MGTLVEDPNAMADDSKRMNHDVMHEASRRPLEVDEGATDTVAASGGLELPGKEGQGNTPAQREDRRDAAREYPPTAASDDKMSGERTNRRGER